MAVPLFANRIVSPSTTGEVAALSMRRHPYVRLRSPLEAARRIMIERAPRPARRRRTRK